MVSITDQPYLRQLYTGIVASAACLVLVGARRDPEFMTYDIEARIVELTVIAAFNQLNSGYNFNGAPDGTHRLIVPPGWQVRIAFANRDVIPHSVAAIRETKLMPLRIARPFFRGAASKALLRGGVPAGGREDGIEFVANVPGSYLIACGMTGHAALGTYIRMVVTADAIVPSYGVVPRTGTTTPND
jgi:hypothetical protein